MVGTAFDRVAHGYDDLTIGFDMARSRCIQRLNELPGLQSRSGKMLGDRGSFGVWCHLLGRSAAFWRPETNRLYVQAKLAPQGSLVAPEEVSMAAQGLMERMAVVGIVSYEPPFVTRADVAVDCRCAPDKGKVLLDGLAASRLPNGWRVTEAGQPRSTVYFRARVKDTVLVRAYCRNLKTRNGEAYGLIRLEASERWPPQKMPLSNVENPQFAGILWQSRFGGLAGRVTRLMREDQMVKLTDKVRLGEMGHAQGERMAAFLDLERLGLAASFYPPQVHAARRREARKLGLAPNDSGMDAIDIELGELLQEYAGAFL